MSEALVVIDATIVGIKSKTLRTESRAIMRLKGVGRVQLLAQLITVAARGQESRTAMFGKGAQTKTSRVSGQSSLRPLFIIRDEASKLLEASSDISVEGFEGFGMEASRNNPHGVNHLAEASAAPEESEGNLRVRELSQGSQDLTCLGDSRLRVAVAEVRIPDWASKQLEIPIGYDFEIGGEPVE